MESDNKKIAKNAVALTLRMILVTVVGLYTSRIVLNALGVEDFGIYGVVGGIVSITSFLNAAMAGASSRFITFEIGTGNFEKLKIIFSSSFIIHFLIALLVLLVGETVGLWFLNQKMVIPDNKMFAANILYQFSILSVIIGFTQVPYTADIIGHEKMNIFAYIEILNSTLKLAIAYILLLAGNQRLIIYGALTFGVTLVIAMIYRIYCIKNFPESHLKFIYDKSIIKDLMSFSVLDLYGNMCFSINNNGRPILLNLFFGVIANAAASIAATVANIAFLFSSTILQAFRPQIIKSYAKNDLRNMEISMKRSSQFTILVYALIAIPIFIEIEDILFLWLGQIPKFTPQFIRLTIISAVISVIPLVNNSAIHATGDIRRISFISGSLYLLCFLASYIWLKLNGSVFSPYLIFILNNIIIALFSWYFVFKQIPGFKIVSLVLNTIKIITIIISCAFIIYCSNNIYFNRLSFINSSEIFSKFLHIVIVAVSTLIILVSTSWVFGFNKSERAYILETVKRKFTKFRR